MLLTKQKSKSMSVIPPEPAPQWQSRLEDSRMSAGPSRFQTVTAVAAAQKKRSAGSDTGGNLMGLTKGGVNLRRAGGELNMI